MEEIDGLAARNQGQVGIEARAQCDPIELVGGVPIQRLALDVDDLDPRATATVVYVDAVGRLCPRGPERQRLGLDQPAQDAAGLAAERTAEDNVRPERRRQPRDPEALPAAVEVYLRPVGPGLDRDRQQRGGREDRDPSPGRSTPKQWEGYRLGG